MLRYGGNQEGTIDGCIAIGAVEHGVAVNAPRERRHRIEHLELVEGAVVGGRTVDEKDPSLT
ncbi:MAG: hypothetical protein WB535_05925 [Paenarthrobacter sp.]